MNKFLLMLSCIVALAACDQTANKTSTPANETPVEQNTFKADMAAITARYVALRPEVGTYYGLTDTQAGTAISAQISHYDPASEKARRLGVQNILADLKALDIKGYTPRQKTSYALIAYALEGALRPAETVEYGSVIGEYGNWFLVYPISHLSGPHIEVMTVMEEKAVIKTPQDAEGYIARLNDYPNMVSGVIKKLHHDRDLGVVPPDFVLDNIIKALDAQLVTAVKDHALLTTFTAKMLASDLMNTADYTGQVIKALEDGFYAGTKSLKAALLALRTEASHDVGVFRLKGGEAFYDAMITHMTDTTLSAQEIHNLGLSEVARIHVEMDTLLNLIGMADGTVGERMQILLNDPQYLYEDTEAGRGQLIADMRNDLNRMNQVLPKWFGLLPDQDVAIKAIPKRRELTGCGACYDAPSSEAGTLGTFWINLANIAASPSYSLQTLTYHETNPGHHMQTILGMSDELPIMTTILYSNAAGEGWGLYSESLAAEMGLYEGDPVDDLGRLQAELHRAVRLVVDTGMHAQGWSREDAIEYSIKTEGIHLSEATFEIERYAVWPGQALGYKIGQLKIMELRKRARAALGEGFDVRAFHDRVLEDGSLPLSLLENKIDNWIAAQLAEK